MNEKAVICMPSKNLSVAMYWVQHYYKNLDDHLDGCQSYFISTSKNFEISQIFHNIQKLLKMASKSKKQEQESQQLVSDEESGSEYECSDSGEESDEEMEVSEESEVDEDLVVVSNLFIII